MSNPNPVPSGPPLRALAMVLIALAIVFGGLGALSWSSNSDSEDKSLGVTTDVSVAAQPTTAASASAAAVSATPVRTTSAIRTTTARAEAVGSIPVRVLNNSVVAGLAADTATELRGDGWRVTQTGNFTDRDLGESTVYYGNKTGAKEAATMIAEQLGASVAPATPEISASADGVTVVLTGD